MATETRLKPLAVDLFCGLGGWAEGFLAEGYEVIGFDIERHDYGTGGYPGHLVLQDALTLHGSQFKGAAVIVASPPCQKYSYMAMPWSKAKALIKHYEASPENRAELTALFDACFRIQREASAAAGRHIPLIVENVRGAQRWVGRAKANYGSYYLWGDVGMVGRRVVAGRLQYGQGVSPVRGRKTPVGSWDLTRKNYNADHSWEPEGTKLGGGKSWSDFGKPDYVPFGFNRENEKRVAAKHDGSGWRENGTLKSNNRMVPDGGKCGGAWLGTGNDCSMMRQHSSKSDSRKAASAAIAKIPFPLAQHIARVFKTEFPKEPCTSAASSGVNESASTTETV